MDVTGPPRWASRLTALGFKAEIVSSLLPSFREKDASLEVQTFQQLLFLQHHGEGQTFPTLAVAMLQGGKH